ncbi:unknown [Bacteroides sp. CAG:443]|nr:unknown [Bacteroides sp. CAG:443]
MAPFRIEMLSTSSGLICEAALARSVPPYSSTSPLESSLIGIPSITQSGWFFPLNEFRPRKMIRVEPPIPEPDCAICTPAILPCNMLLRLIDLFSVRLSVLTSCMAYPSAFFSRLIPNAVTTTSLSCSDSTLSWILNFLLFPMAISFSLYPMKEICSMFCPAGTCSSKFPFMSEIVPIEVPFTRMFAPGMLFPCSSVIVPDTVRLSCCTMDDAIAELDGTSSA